MRQAYYRNSFEFFALDDPDRILGILNKRGIEFSSQFNDVNISWDTSIPIFQQAILSLIQQHPDSQNWTILLEYEIPRLGGRIDAVILADDIIFVLEYKNERSKFLLADHRQVEDYALDLFDFHLESRGRIIIPILVAPNAPAYDNSRSNNNFVKECLNTNQDNLPSIILSSYVKFHDANIKIIDSEIWEQSQYHPTPTIIQAAKALFAGQKVEAITKSEAESKNIFTVTNYLINVIKVAEEEKKKVVCFVTGVPGAGKTLVGLNIVHEKEAFGGRETNTAYFSGNGPLIKVLKEALARDHYKTAVNEFSNGDGNKKPKKSTSEHSVKSKIQNLHQFIKAGLRSTTKPVEQIVVFDEAQRCWDADHFYNKSKQNANRETSPFTIERRPEAEILFEIMDRHDWAVIVALVGGGQEINTGEAGIAEWGRVIESKFPKWEVHISPQLFFGDDTTAGAKLFKNEPHDITIKTNEDLHLAVSQRSFRATHLNVWVNAVIDNNAVIAQAEAEKIKDRYPLLITRDLSKAKEWLRNKILGNKRIGLTASSGGMRLRPYGINVKDTIDEARWFLNDETDVRSSYYLEVTATEFAVQGLELDWIGVCWDCDLRRSLDDWQFKNFSGTTWSNVNKKEDRQYLLNKYRVLMTRAREGLIIWIPTGDKDDPTRLPEFYDPIFEYLKSCGLTEL
jgi:DUF2075 family protein